MQENKTETSIKEFIECGQTEKAVDLLFRMAVTSAKKKAFLEAESYRDKLYEIDSMALTKIVELNEVIEKEKKDAFTPQFRQLWAPFFNVLSDEEASTFFFALDEQTIESEKVILTQGQPNDRLYLVRRGRLKVVYSDQEKELLICTMGPGDFFGHDTCFSLNVSTASVKTLTEVSLGYMDIKRLDNLKGGLAALASDLEKVCNSVISTFDRIKQKGMDRRSFKRIPFNTQVSFQMPTSDHQNALQRPIKAELWDISKGGLSFYFHSKDQEETKRMIGRKIVVRIKLDDKDRQRKIVVPGIVQGVGSHPVEEYSVHVKFERNLNDAAMKTLQNIATPSLPCSCIK